MLYIVRTDTTVIELAEAVEAHVRGDLLVCLDAEGETVHVYPRADVMAYGTNELLKHATEASRKQYLPA